MKRQSAQSAAGLADMAAGDFSAGASSYSSGFAGAPRQGPSLTNTALLCRHHVFCSQTLVIVCCYLFLFSGTYDAMGTFPKPFQSVIFLRSRSYGAGYLGPCS